MRTDDKLPVKDDAVVEGEAVEVVEETRSPARGRHARQRQAVAKQDDGPKDGSGVHWTKPIPHGGRWVLDQDGTRRCVEEPTKSEG